MVLKCTTPISRKRPPISRKRPDCEMVAMPFQAND